MFAGYGFRVRTSMGVVSGWESGCMDVDGVRTVIDRPFERSVEGGNGVVVVGVY